MDELYWHWTRRLVYTAGVKWMADAAQAYWLVDACASWLLDQRLRGEEFLVFTLKVNPDKSATLMIGDGNDGPPLVTQHIPFTDFGDSGETECQLYCVGPEPLTLMLPIEY